MGKKPEDVRFGKFGTVSFTQTTRVNDFIDYLENGNVMYTHCNACGMDFFPPRADCAGCLSSDMGWREVVGTGKLVSYSQLKYAPVGFRCRSAIQHRHARLRPYSGVWSARQSSGSGRGQDRHAPDRRRQQAAQWTTQLYLQKA